MSGDQYLDPANGAGFWIGHPGALYHVHGTVSPYGIEDQAEPVITTSLGGGRRARVPRSRANRAWKVDIPDVYPQDVANLRHLLAATMGPYVFVDPWGQKTNLLTPEESVLSSVTVPSGGLAYGGGWILRDLGNQWAPTTRSNPSASVVHVGPAPVPPAWASRTVTASCWAASSGTARVDLQWLNGTGHVVETVQGTDVTGMDGLRRSSASGTPAWGAVACRVQVVGAEVLTQAAVTWTDSAMPWDAGNGARRVVVSEVSRGVTRASRHQRLHDFSFTVTEVGPAVLT